MNINHISVSRKQTWDQCTQQYLYKYHLRQPPPIEQEEPWYFTYGTIIHKIAEEYVRAAGARQINEVANDVINGVIDIDDDGRKAPPMPQEYKKKMPEHLRGIHGLVERTGFGGHLEYEFKYDLDPPNGRNVFGYIDRLIEKNGKFWIFDYKTTKKGWWRKGPSKIAGDLQLRCYARVVQKTFGAKAEDIKAALYYLDGNELVGCCFSEASLEAAEKELLDCYLEIHNTPPEAAYGRVGEHCSRCDYRSVCPFYSLV